MLPLERLGGEMKMILIFIQPHALPALLLLCDHLPHAPLHIFSQGPLTTPFPIILFLIF